MVQRKDTLLKKSLPHKFEGEKKKSRTTVMYGMDTYRDDDRSNHWFASLVETFGEFLIFFCLVRIFMILSTIERERETIKVVSIKIMQGVNW